MAKKTASVNQKYALHAEHAQKYVKRSYIYLFRLLRESRSGSMCRMRSLCKTCPPGVIELIERECKMKRNTGMIICGFGQLFILL